ncbi:DUF724 domain-containing protein 3-like [Cucurbita moschata]|uniref:DUF724 domain-containing protein 3-like n=1 Tax=Cucurbita moschata TaxID=3662 RepID=A0A6J1H6M9_CUCMO|nr:DUF724 domain-containing protein 3-like [Cucurbita moschata]
MGEFDSPSTHLHRHPRPPFTVGSEIEISINEEGFKGALFRATILKLSTTFFPSTTKKAFVEYKTLVTEDGSKPLKEHVDAHNLRPIPPDIADRDFEEGDIVDAADKDGWWTGVVYKVSEDGGYSVFFKNPMHVMDFQRKQLRLHQDWVDGKWLVPKKMDASILKDQLATILEVANIPEKTQTESLKNAETNHEKGNSRNDLVEQSSICEEKSASFALTSSKRRSLSSKARVSNSVKKWGKGNVPGAPTADGLKETESKTSRGKSSSKKNATSNRGRKRRTYHNFHCDDNSDSPGKFKSSKGDMKARTEKDVDGNDELKEQGARFINDEEGKEDCDVLVVTHKEVSTSNESEGNKHLASEEKQTTPAETSIHVSDEVKGGEKNSNNQTEEKGLEPDQQQASKNSNKRKRGRPKKLMIVPITAEDKEQNGIGWKPDEATIKSCVTDFQLNRKNLNKLSAYKTNENGPKSASSNIDDDDRPLLMWLGGMQGSASNNSLKLGQTPGSTGRRRTKRREQVDVPNEVVKSDHALDRNQGWPFVKNSPVWSAIDSLEVFKLIPQTPHFCPLSTYKEECREGLAIGCMVTFASLVEKISKLQFDNPRHVFESLLASLFELEQHGFNISMLCNRVNELLFIKDTQMRYLEETKEAEMKILEHTENKTKLTEESKAIEQKIAELQKRQTSIQLELETKDAEIEALQSRVETIRGSTEDTKKHFERQTALPL